MLVLQVSLVPEGSLGSLDIQGAVISLDVTRPKEEVSPDCVSAEVMISWLVSGYFSWARQRPLFILQAPSVLQSLLCKAVRVIPMQSTWINASSMGCSSAILHGLTHNCSSGQAGGEWSRGISSSCPQQCFHGGWREEQSLSSYIYISWRLSGTKTWAMKKFTGTEQKVYKGKGLILCHSFSDLDIDLFICSVASSFPHTDFVPWWLGRRQLKTLLFPGNLWKKTPRTPKEPATRIADVLCFFNAPSFLYGQVDQTPQPVSGGAICLHNCSAQTHIARPTAGKKAQLDTQADRLARKRNTVLKCSEITDNSCLFVCLWFLSVSCCSVSPAQRKTAPRDQRGKSTGVKLHFLLAAKVTKSSTTLALSAFGRMLMVSLQGCFVHKHCSQRSPHCDVTNHCSTPLGLGNSGKALHESQTCAERSWRLTYCLFHVSLLQAE